MNIEVIKQIDNENRAVYRFTTIDFNVIFTTFLLEEKPKGKRIWRVTGIWTVYDRRNNTIEEPMLPDEIKDQAFKKTCELIHVLTWQEYKN